jgi:uncharacterized protein YkwD
MRKNIMLLLAVFLILININNEIHAANSGAHIEIFINGKHIGSDVSPIIIDGRTLVPIRVISEEFGLQVGWHTISKVVHLFSNENSWVKFKIDNKNVNSSGGNRILDVPPVIYNGRTMIPLRVIAEYLGMNVEWVPSAAGQPAKIYINKGQTEGLLKLPKEKLASYILYEDTGIKKYITSDGNQIQGNFLTQREVDIAAGIVDKENISGSCKLKNMGFSQEELNYILNNNLTDYEQKLFDAINTYRNQYNLPAFTLNMDLTIVARTHIVDSIKNNPKDQIDSRGKKGNLHSWSVSPYWSGGAYTSDHKYAEIMWDKPGELTDFTGNGYENAYYCSGTVTPGQAMDAWTNSSGHNAVLMGEGFWSNLTQIGVAVEGSYAFIWFAE